MSKPASAPDVIPERKRAPASPSDASEGTNGTRSLPDPKADAASDGDRKHVPRSPFTTGNV